MRKQWSFRALAVLLVVSLLVTMGNQGLLTLGENIVSVNASGDTADDGIGNYITYNGTVDLSTLGNDLDAPDDEKAPEQTLPDDTPEGDTPSDDTPSAEEEAAARLYTNGTIHLFNFRQLQLVGSGAQLTTGDDQEETVGSGTPVTDENGQPVTYSGDAKYFLEGDITLPKDKEWQLPADFSGEFTSEERSKQDDPEKGEGEDEGSSEPGEGDSPGDEEGSKNERLYDVESDTIFIQNIFQLKTLGDLDRANIPVMTGDWSAEKFGIGQMIYPDGESGGYLTYSTRHIYVISSEFSAKQPEEVSIALRGEEMLRSYADPDVEHLDGRTYVGQVTVTVGRTEYILIGDRQQLEAINHGRTVASKRVDVEVWGPVYHIDGSTQELIYPGDADLIGDYADNVMYDGNNGISSDDAYHSLLLRKYCPVNPETGKVDKNEISNPINLKYTTDGNYIVFRNLDMGGSENPWTPMMFSGTMIGAVAPAGGMIWNDGKTDFNSGCQKAVFSNIYVVPATHDGALDVGVHQGVGFFGTLSATDDHMSDLGNFTKVKNLKLSGGSVVNNCTETYIEPKLVGSLTGDLGDVGEAALGLVLKLVLKKDDVDAGAFLDALLNATPNDPTSLATGAFVGRVRGGVEISGCEVENISVKTVKTSFENKGLIVGKGGFVGSVQGEFAYNLAALQRLIDRLGSVLNVVPGLGLGALIDILFNNALPLGTLIPKGYNQPLITGCYARSTTLNQDNGKYGVGGFAGSVCGTKITDSKVVSDKITLNVRADHFGGGFAGVVRDDVIRQTLNDLANVSSLFPMSEIVHCSVEVKKLNVSGRNYLGGFAGVQANSYVIECDLNVPSGIKLSGSGECVGGFTGSAQLGTTFTLDDYLPVSGSLLGTVTAVLEDAAGSQNGQVLLALGGVSPSGIVGCRIYGRLDVGASGDMVGGIVGKGEAVQILKSSDILLLGKYASGNATPPATSGDRKTTVSQLYRVRTWGNYAGGIAGYLMSASTKSLLGDTLGAKAFLGYLVEDVDVYGVPEGYFVEADGDYAGGGFGYAIGGDVGFSEDYAFDKYLTDSGQQDYYNNLPNTSATEEDKDDFRKAHIEGAVLTCVNGNDRAVTLHNLQYVKGNNHVGGFVGTTGPDKLGGEGGLDVSLLGISVLSINNLVGLTSGIHSNFGNCFVSGIEGGYYVQAVGARDEFDDEDLSEYSAGGFAGDTTSVTMINCHASALHHVLSDDHSGKSGGFVGDSAAGNLTGVATKGDGIQLIQVQQLFQIGADVVPSFEMCDVIFSNGGYVKGNAAGGFAGVFRSGTVNVMAISQSSTSPYAVYNIDHVLGGEYAGGFGGKVFSGALEREGGGLKLFDGVADLDLGGLRSVTNQYMPRINYAGVKSDNGFTVLAAYVVDVDDEIRPATKGMAGGYIGFGSGMMVSHCDVTSLKKRTPSIPANLEGKDGSAYMSFKPENAAVAGWEDVPYSVAGAHFAGGYIGYMNVGSSRALGDTIKLLDQSLRTTAVLQGLQMVVSTIEHSDVYGKPGGYSVLASSHVNLGDGSFDEKGVGYAGGFAGKMAGAHIQDSNANNFSYIIGEVAAGGYAGEMDPGDVLDVLDYQSQENSAITDLFSGILATDDLLAVIQSFVPTIYNSRTTCIPCGGAVRAHCASDSDNVTLPVLRGCAGGYVGRIAGAQIWGDSNAAWLGDEVYGNKEGEDKRPCDAVRIRSVYGAEYAGGYVGLMEAASTAKGGSLSVLGGLISADSLVGALDVVYPTVEQANVYGPLEKLSAAQWNSWIEHVGMDGSFAGELAAVGTVTDDNVEEKMSQFIYGYHVVAGRDEFDDSAKTILAGCAGGFAGAMHSGIIRNATANNAKKVVAMKSAGGFAGEMQTQGLANFGEVSLLNGIVDLQLGSLVKAASVLVPVVYESGVTGYQNGLIVTAEGFPTVQKVVEGEGSKTVKTDGGYAGGFVGACYGGQIGNKADGRIDLQVQEPVNGAWARKIKTVKGKNCIGGFVGRTTAASVANADASDASDGLIQNVLDTVLTNSNPTQLLSVLNATLTVIGKAEVTAASPEWGIVVDGEYEDENHQTTYAHCAGGFVGSSEATVFGNKDVPERTLTVTGLRGVSGGYYAGGFFGLAHVGSVAQVGDNSGSTSLLNLIKTENVSVLDIFRTYIYHATVTGVEDGIRIFAHEQTARGTMSTYQVGGAAGGFGGGMMNGTVENSSVTGLNAAQATNYAAGFVGLSGTSGGIGSDGIEVENSQQTGGDPQTGDLLALLGLDDLGLNAQLLNVVGSTFTNCSATGIDNGFVVRTTNIQLPPADTNEADVKGSCAAGFNGFSDMAHFDSCSVSNFKFAKGPQIAGGFVGRSAINYLIDLDVNSKLTGAVVGIVNVLVRALYLKEAQQLDLINFTDTSLLGLKVLSDGDLLYVNLQGLVISASLCKEDPEYPGYDSVTVNIGSSTVKLPCSQENGVDWDSDDTPDISVTLIEGNRTEITNCTVKGINDGYDIYAGCSDEENDGTNSFGYAGGFIGYNDAGKIKDSSMELCDVVRGTPNEESQPTKVGPFTGYLDSRSRGDDIIEGETNQYSIYRSDNGGYTETDTAGGTSFSSQPEKATIHNEECNRYVVTHREVIKEHSDLEGAVESHGTASNRDLLAYVSPAMAVLMLNIPLDDNGIGDTPITMDLKDPCDMEFDLTINKIWRDFIYLGSRPDHITVTVAKVDCGEQPPQNLVTFGSTEGMAVVKTQTLTLDNSSGSTWSSTWKATLEALPVAYRITEGGQEKTKYYQYVVNEVEFDNYKAYYEKADGSDAVTITNRYTGPLLPTTGGGGVLMFYAVGMFLLIGGGMLLILLRTSGKKKQLCATGTAGNVKNTGLTGNTELDISNFSDFFKDLKKKKKK